MATGAALCIPANTTHSTVTTETVSRMGGTSSGSTSLATPILIRRPRKPLHVTPLENFPGQDFSQPVGHSPSRPPVAQLDCLVLERILLRRANLSGKVIRTMQASQRPSTNYIYDTSWHAFCWWSAQHHIAPTSASVPEVLEFLQAGLNKGLAPPHYRDRWPPYRRSLLVIPFSPSHNIQE